MSGPQNPSIFIKTSPELRERIQQQAAREHRSVSNFVAHVLTQHLDTLESECNTSTSVSDSALPASSVSESPAS